MGIKQTLGTILLAGAIGLSGCSREAVPPSGYVEGRVIKEYGSIVNLVNSQNHISGGLLGGGGDVNTVKFGNPSYGIQVETFNGVYTIDFDDSAGSPGPRTLQNLAVAIEEGMRVRFPTENVPHQKGQQPTGFSSDRLGVLDPDDIEVLRK